MPNIDIYCSCGKALCSQSEWEFSNRRNDPSIVVEPCKDCLNEAQLKGYKERENEEVE